MRKGSWFANRTLLLELFILANLAFLALDVFIAHSVNAFAHWGEWIPFGFSLASPIALLVSMLSGEVTKRWGGLIVGWLAVAVGIGGMLFHLESQFFEEMTIASLVYTAPFAAPLAYTGLGLLLLMNRTVSTHSVEWGQWVILLTLGGFFGNFALSLADHAQNGFFNWREWIPVISSAIAVGFLIVAIFQSSEPALLKLCQAILILNGLVGLLGFYFHLMADLHGIASTKVDNFLYGAPVFAPLLFPNLALLGAFGCWHLIDFTKGETHHD